MENGEGRGRTIYERCVRGVAARAAREQARSRAPAAMRGAQNSTPTSVSQEAALPSGQNREAHRWRSLRVARASATSN